MFFGQRNNWFWQENINTETETSLYISKSKVEPGVGSTFNKIVSPSSKHNKYIRQFTHLKRDVKFCLTYSVFFPFNPIYFSLCFDSSHGSIPGRHNIGWITHQGVNSPDEGLYR